MIVKKLQNDIRELSDYRPISLTNIMYKIFALLQKPLATYFDPLSLDLEQTDPPANPSTS